MNPARQMEGGRLERSDATGRKTDMGKAPEASDHLVLFVGLQAIQKHCNTDFKVG